MPILPVPLLKDAGVKKQGISPPDVPICYKWNLKVPVTAYLAGLSISAFNVGRHTE